ncbi:E3 ubiquitin-protein ligase DCST1 isoform X2 [Canis lupus familiaris]|uniref:E3 ubiquitin-protein ligase DCST1 isoform X2 n=1 Tax=Canis lupus familiaris TaxID=9615 RepID=UPI000BAA2120|nr:E3 ubiquitin-protein ligase DCST1 isoform X2 [Canis lupus familiaris]XP_025286810.1 E3 ubiquitin-protein ligase DCST1 isoform X3 [Canis lupus dingo]XP_038399106.1 E3 ubiquitin-protein ligase DCST1 isoform X2 [Canis lupus familiaris]XP_038527935.1 E3 ubiquitin-protein ligase DCST1 isoform X2 [Canis lupus familiaris]|eukprot:XP_022277026.1 DC-STAMP domain-containing protein 1 isoform X2 [Canis lupus familiaris]
MDIRLLQDGATGQKGKVPHTTLQKLLSWGLPVMGNRFLQRQPGEFPVSAFLLGASTGGLLAVGLFQLLVNPMNIYEDQKMVTLYSLVGLGVVGWGTSPHIRCASLLLVPKMLGKEGRLFVLGYALAAIYEGPAANLRNNLNEVISSLGCTVQLQINNTRKAWRVSVGPLRAVLKDLLASKDSLKAETQNITKSFEDLDDQVNSETGYTLENSMGLEGTARGGEMYRAVPSRYHLSTQKMYELKTKLRCSYVVDQAILSCQRWFDQKHKQCMQRIWVPLLNHLLCLPMTFKFFCSIARAMEVWCRSRIPVEGNFGQTYDSVNQSIHDLGGEFSATIDLKEEKQAWMLGLNTSWEHVSAELQDYVLQQEAQLEWTLGLLRVLLSCTFLLVFRASFSYVDSYNGDIRFDNIYISTYFCQIDERRKKLVRELVETVPVLLLLLLLCGLDWALYSIFDTIRHHSFLQYSFRSSHKLEVKVGGDSMLARLLRKTIGALNSSSETVVESNNMPCLPQPMALDARAYLRAALPTGLLLCLCLLQAFAYRLRRVIAAFYFPKREKKRILFLYNDLLRKRAAFTKLRRAAIVRRAQQQKPPHRGLAAVLDRRCPLLRRWLRQRCVVCQAPQTPEAYLCPTPDCGAVYCQSCWDDMRRRCPACTPREELSSSAYSDSNDDATYAE